MTESRELNLTTHRAPGSVWERRGWNGTRQQLAMTRMLVGVGGGALALQGIRQRTMLGSLLAGFGGGLAWWALAGEGDLSEARLWLGQLLGRAGWVPRDRVHDESAESVSPRAPPPWAPPGGTRPSGRAAHPLCC